MNNSDILKQKSRIEYIVCIIWRILICVDLILTNASDITYEAVIIFFCHKTSSSPS